MPSISRPSLASVLIKMRFYDHVLARGTGFVVIRNGTPSLVTNRHNVTGLNQDTGEPLDRHGALPHALEIVHNSIHAVGRKVERVERLFDDAGRARWREHPVHGEKVDVVALPLTEIEDVAWFDHDPWKVSPDIPITPACDLSIIGYPYGLSGGNDTAIWSRGTIASEPNIDYDGLPRFLIDSRTRKGQSGSPVLHFHPGGVAAMADGSSAALGVFERFLGVYSGRTSSESDLGFVWNATAVRDVVGSGKRPA